MILGIKWVSLNKLFAIADKLGFVASYSAPIGICDTVASAISISTEDQDGEFIRLQPSPASARNPLRGFSW
jgi:hypothetical protein